MVNYGLLMGISVSDLMEVRKRTIFLAIFFGALKFRPNIFRPLKNGRYLQSIGS